MGRFVAMRLMTGWAWCGEAALWQTTCVCVYELFPKLWFTLSASFKGIVVGLAIGCVASRGKAFLIPILRSPAVL
jgi:hypothetical protein